MTTQAQDATARLDADLVRRGLARSRGQARELLDAGRVRVGGRVVGKPAHRVTPTDEVSVDGGVDPWVSRAAHKLVAALDRWPDLPVRGRRCIDVGASTGGFTQVLLARGAARVCALDVGHGQLDPVVADDERVVERSGTSVRDVDADDLGGTFDLLVTDLSFISLTLVAGRLAALVSDGGDVVALVKPQFEVGRQRLGRGGVVRDPRHRAEAAARVVAAFAEAGLEPVDLALSPITGTDGNVELLLRARRTSTPHHDPEVWQAAADRLTTGGAQP